MGSPGAVEHQQSAVAGGTAAEDRKRKGHAFVQGLGVVSVHRRVTSGCSGLMARNPAHSRSPNPYPELRTVPTPPSVSFLRGSGLDAPITAPIDLVVRDLGEIAYAEACVLQRDLQRRVIESRRAPGGERRMYLLLLEHVPPVITISRRRAARSHLLAGGDQLAAAGVEVARTDRGGDITYHGPGQLVVYPILDLNALGLRLHGYMRFLEQIAIDTLGSFRIPARRDPTGTGVWVTGKDSATERRSEGGKICSMGVRISRWVSMHGLALNVTTNLDHFDLIVPCGLSGVSVTSMERELGDACPAMQDVKDRMCELFKIAVARLSADRAVSSAP